MSETPRGEMHEAQAQDKIKKKAEQFFSLFEHYKGPQAAYMMEDIVALSLR